jgi:hypothetical protein
LREGQIVDDLPAAVADYTQVLNLTLGVEGVQ